MADLTRQQLKKDELNELVITAVEWVKNNRQKFYSIAGTVLGAILLAVFIFYRYNVTKSKAFEKLAAAQSMVFSSQQNQGLKLIDEIIKSYPTSKLGYEARLTKGNFLIETQKYDQAETILLPITQKGKPKKIVPLAYTLLGVAQENSGKYNEALGTYNQFIKTYPNHFFAPKVYESIARVYEMTKQTENAKSIYSKITTLYPTTAWANRAQERLNVLSKS